MKKATITLFAALALLLGSISYAAELVVIVHNSNPMSAMSSDEVKKHYLKATARWGSGKKIRPADSKYDLELRNIFLSEVLNMNDVEIDRYWIKQQYASATKPPAELPDSAAVVRFVAQFDGAIGFIERDALEDPTAVKEVMSLSY